MTVPPRIPPRPRTRNGTAPRPPSSIDRAELAQRGQQRADRARGGPGVAAELHVGPGQRGDRRDEPQHGARVARRRTGCAAPARRPGVTRQAGTVPVPPAVPSLVPPSSIWAPSARSAPAISSGVPGPQRAGDDGRAVRQRGEDQRAVGHRFRPGQPQPARTGPAAAGACQSGAEPGSALLAPLGMLRAYWPAPGCAGISVPTRPLRGKSAQDRPFLREPRPAGVARRGLANPDLGYEWHNLCFPVTGSTLGGRPNPWRVSLSR